CRATALLPVHFVRVRSVPGLSAAIFFSFSLFFYCSVYHRDLHSFPTLRSSDLPCARPFAGGCSKRRWPRRRRPPWRPATRPSPSDRKSTRLNSSHGSISYAVFCLKKKRREPTHMTRPATPTPRNTTNPDTTP